jgi:zinc-ribbon domain
MRVCPTCGSNPPSELVSHCGHCGDRFVPVLGLYDIVTNDGAPPRLPVAEINLRAQTAQLKARVQLLEGLLQETMGMHLRYEENRNWLERRDHVLGLVVGGPGS